MGDLKKYIQLSVFMVLCQSHCIYTFTSHKEICLNKFITFLENLDTKLKNDNIALKIRLKKEEERIICDDILNMNKNHTKNTNFVITIELNHLNIVSLSILFILIILGSYYLWKIGTRPVCYCKMCKEVFIIKEKFSEGGFGEIYKVHDKKDEFILKRCKTENITEADDILIEAKCLHNLNHKNIVKYIDDFIHIEYKGRNLEPIYYVNILMEYCEEGDLKQKIDNMFYQNKYFTKKEILELLIQICEGLNYLHNKKIIHRDIKSQNIFIKRNGNLRIGDFGLAKKIKNRNTFMTKVGTDSYMAPEVIQGETYGKAADVWSLGCVIFEICTLNLMWLYDSPLGISSLTKKDYVDNFINEISNKEYIFFKEILKSIFVNEPIKRIKIETLLKKLKKEYKQNK